MGIMNNLQELKKRIDKRNKVLQEIKIGEHIIFQIKNNFFLGGIFQETISKIDTKKIAKMNKSKQEEEMKKNIDIQKLFKSIEEAVKSTYTLEEYKLKINELRSTDDELNEFLSIVLEGITLEELYDIQLGLNNDNLNFYGEILSAMFDGIDKKK